MISKDRIILPLNFERRGDVRLLGRALPEKAPWRVFCVWMEWATVGQEWRPLQHPIRSEDLGADGSAINGAWFLNHRWIDEEITFLIESSCGTAGDGEYLIIEMIKAGVLKAEKRGDVMGLILNDFAKYNEHLLPGYVSMQQKGAIASCEARRKKEDGVAGKQQGRILEMQEGLPIFEGESATRDEIDAGITLIMQLDRACAERPRLSQDFTEALIEASVEVNRKFGVEQIEGVLVYLIERRNSPAVVKRADFVLNHFAEYVQNVPRGTKGGK